MRKETSQASHGGKETSGAGSVKRNERSGEREKTRAKRVVRKETVETSSGKETCEARSEKKEDRKYKSVEGQGRKGERRSQKRK